MTHQHGIQCILPPHILNSIARNGQAEQRNWAISTLSKDTSLRSQRTTEQLLRRVTATAAPSVAASKNRSIYTANQTSTLPGTKVRSEGDGPNADVAVNEAYDGLGATFDLYWNAYQRNSIDNAGLELIGTVHYGQSYDNAFWNDQQMVFGDGDGQLFNRFTIAIDVIGHELTHGVTGHQANLVYQDQPGALNESISDVFGSLVKQYAATPQQTAAQADWLIGAGLLAATVKGVALRSMKAPGTAYDDPILGTDPQPDHMDRYVTTSSDNGGVHINSGIPNKAFYLAATAIAGYAWEKAGKIWYATVCDPRLSSTAQFQDFANLTTDNAGKLFGQAEQQAVAQAWAQVGINVGLPALSGEWILHFSWGATTQYGQSTVSFNGDGSFGGSLPGQWRLRDGSLLLSFNTGPAKYAGTIDTNVACGAMSTFEGLDGAWYLTRKGIVGVLEDVAGNALSRQQPVNAAGDKW
jgi:Zn-dependent metalloprotease